jgi:thiol-disulfide isomerase/thioredoxin
MMGRSIGARLAVSLGALSTLMAAGVAVAAVAAAAALPPNLKSIDGNALKKAVADQKGKVVVLNVWATWCGPCVEEFPFFVKLSGDYKSKGLAVIGVSLDEPEDRGKVATFIGKTKTTFPMYMRTTRTMDEFIQPLDKKWVGTAPTTYFFDKGGKMAGAPINGPVTYDKLVKKVQPLLK